MNNVANDEKYADIKKELADKLETELKAQQDPRILEEPCRYEKSPYTDDKFGEEVNDGRKANAGSIPGTDDS
jgi:hypothetical protein